MFSSLEGLSNKQTKLAFKENWYGGRQPNPGQCSNKIWVEIRCARTIYHNWRLFDGIATILCLHAFKKKNLRKIVLSSFTNQ